MVKSLMTSAALLLLAVAVHAADTGDAAAAPLPDLTKQEVKVTAPLPAEPPPELTCHQESQTGSSILHKVCRKKELTPDELAAIRQDKQQINYEAGVAKEQWMADKFKLVKRNN